MFDSSSQVELMKQVSYSVSAGTATSITLTNTQVNIIKIHYISRCQVLYSIEGLYNLTMHYTISIKI